ncbi:MULTISPECIES: lipid II-degrading bacteriocin [Klebsiella]|nr:MULTISPECIES: lipid II-degrading bacteriocin [Klebsiella]MCS6089436.1 lipid II-degrading bacteriocin [Klebsiella pneumoniae subsp. pneumoniae]HBT4825074.1 lipid II-degrading bacteriocin [Klebsiella quasipneumoniae subsp. similipneumoniae]HDT5529470.1 lipid II-degrading bacteriocin [Klebsiella pneumoniae subsp. ozaenae]EIV2285192.1 lipid II-degrading bacteriocin [Klebsiella pneumoniae]EIX9292147.1 lipid II-degrading bacteriocin [Klebsiella pneumoniae]
MSGETMTVTASVPPVGNLSYGGGMFSPTISGPSEGQIFLQVTLPYYQSEKFCADQLNWLVQYIKKHGASDPMTIQVAANNIRYLCNADTNLVKNPKTLVYDAFHSRSPAPANYDYRSMNLKQMSGSVVTPGAAFAHYLWGNGETRFVNLPDVGLKVTPQQIPELMKLVNSGVTGAIPVSVKFSRDTSTDSITAGAYLGHITLQTEGTLNVTGNGAWTYNGVIRAYDDTYDFNLGNFRGPIAESLTFLGSTFSGKPYQISLPGQINISGSGKR